MPSAKTKASATRSNPTLSPVIVALRARIKSLVPAATEFVNPWGLPTFETNEPFAYFMVGKKHVTLGLHYGTSVPDPHKLLEGTGKNLRHVKLRAAEDLNREGLDEIIVAAARFKPVNPKTAMRGKR